MEDVEHLGGNLDLFAVRRDESGHAFARSEGMPYEELLHGGRLPALRSLGGHDRGGHAGAEAHRGSLWQMWLASVRTSSMVASKCNIRNQLRLFHLLVSDSSAGGNEDDCWSYRWVVFPA